MCTHGVSFTNSPMKAPAVLEPAYFPPEFLRSAISDLFLSFMLSSGKPPDFLVGHL